MGARRRGAHRRQQQKVADANSDEQSGTQQPARAAHQPSRAASGLKPDQAEVLGAVRSLYADQLKPFGRILRKRLSERAAAAQPPQTGAAGGSALPDIDIKHLRAVCDECEEFSVTPEEGGDWSVVLLGRDPPFVDIYSSVDCYSEEFWSALAVYFEGLSEEERSLPGGRYSCAQMLKGRDLAFLDQYSLGQVCHIVQIAISQRKVLGYSDGAVVPYKHSQSMVKEQCAMTGQACAATGWLEGAPAAGLPLASWDFARQHLREILAGAEVPEEGGLPQVPLSNIKRLFRSRYQTELSETSLGYSKLSDLLQDHKFRDICRVELQGHGYTVVQNFEPPSVTKISLADSLTKISIADSLLLSEEAPLCAAGLAEPRRLEFAGLEELCMEDFAGGRTPLPSPGVPNSTTVRKWNRPVVAPVVEAPLSFFPEEPLGSECDFGAGIGLLATGQFASLPPLESPGGLARARPSVWCEGEPLCFEEAEVGLRTPGVGLATPLPSPGVPSSTTVRRWPIAPPEAPQRVEFCAGEPLCLEEAGFAGLSLPGLSLSPGGQLPVSTPLRSPGVPTSTTTRRWPSMALSPSTLAKDGHVGSIVQNTFIHQAPAPPTPLPGARLRSHSLPKDTGSDRNSWESACDALGYLPRPVADGATESTLDSAAGSAAISLSTLGPSRSSSSSLSREEASRSLSPEMDAATPKRVEMGTLESAVPLLLPLRGQSAKPADEPFGRIARFCVGEELPLEELDVFPDDITPAPRRAAASSPTMFGKQSPTRWTVQNTFIHQALAPPTPVPGTMRRSRSVPKDTGSDNMAWEGRTPRAQPQAPAKVVAVSPGTRRDTCPSIEASPAFVPTGPALTASPGGLAYLGGGWTMPRAKRGDDAAATGLVLRLSDHL